MPILNPIHSSTPGNPVSYNPNIADTFSWIPIDTNNSRTLYAQAVYSTNYSHNFGQAGLRVLTAGTYYINCVGIQTTASTTVQALTSINNIFTGTLALPADFTINGLVKGIQFTGGPVIAYLQ
jgi:hypothetical protein